MPKLHSLAALLAASAMLCLAAPALAAPATVNLRVEGATQTIFEGAVTTDTHLVDGGDGTGAHECDGLNNGNPNNYAGPGPTVTGALDDGSKLGGFAWFGTFGDFGTPDFYIRSIGGQHDTSSTFWYLVRNWKGLQTGGCQEQVEPVQPGDDVLIALTGFDPNTFAAWPLLDLRGAPDKAAVNEPFTVHVLQHDGQGSPATNASGVTVAGSTTGADGTASVSFDSPGVKHFKAEHSGSIRSNALTVCVYVPGSGDCGTGRSPGDTTEPTPTATPAPAARDTTPPVVHVTSLKAGKTYSPGPRELAGDVSDAGGIAQVFLRLRTTNGGDLTSASKCRWFSGKRGLFTHRTVACSKARFFRIGSNARWSYLLPSKLRKGSYVLDVKALDRAYNAGRATVRFKVK
jgi:hypothetical protein